MIELENIELYTTPDGEVMVKQLNSPVFVLTQKHREFIEAVMAKLRNMYPIAFQRLAENYSKSEQNRYFYEYKMVHRFLRCNFGEYDQNRIDIDAVGNFHFEEVRCPLRGECRDEGVICRPKLNNKLTSREEEVLALFGQALTSQQVADLLGISVCTAKRHRMNILNKLKLHSSTQLVAYYQSHKE